MKKYGRTISMLVIMASILFGMNMIAYAQTPEPENFPDEEISETKIISVEYIPYEPPEPPEPEYPLTEEEMELIAVVTMAEVENQSEYCKRLVIDTILNRVDSRYFPNTVKKVIYAKNQFEVTVNGRMDRCYVKDDILELVKEEVLNRTNKKVVFFNSIGFNNWSKPLLKEGAVYFSACQYEE